MRPLTPKQVRFVDEYLLDLNATQAAIRAGYSAKSARSIGEENLTKPDIKTAIQIRQASREKRTEIAQDDVVKGLLSEAKYFGSGASPSARVRAWELLGKHVGMLDERYRLEHSGPSGGPIRLTMSRLSDADLNTIETILARAEAGPSAEAGAGVNAGGAA